MIIHVTSVAVEGVRLGRLSLPMVCVETRHISSPQRDICFAQELRHRPRSTAPKWSLAGDFIQHKFVSANPERALAG
jgi:hypothetical protein